MPKFSFSQLNVFMTCPKRFFWGYERRLVPAVEVEALAVGRAVHEGLSDQPGETVWHEVGRLARAYWPKQHMEETEVHKEFDLAGEQKLVCIADAVTAQHVIEYKTTSRANANTYNALAISPQLRMYGLVFNKPAALLRVIVKPQIRQRQTESEETFQQRLLDLFREHPEEHFLQIEIPLPDPRNSTLLDEIRMVIDTIDTCRRLGVWPTAAPYACYGLTPCPYLPLCSDPATNMPLYKIKEENSNDPNGEE